MNLSRYNLKNVDPGNVTIPPDEIFELPEKVLQFGTGVLLRGLPDYFIDKANRQGNFNGRIVVVKSTTQGDTSAFEAQDGLYTVCIRGLQSGQKVEENIVNSSISRVLNAGQEWEAVLACAHNAALKIVISNTTEMGIELVNDDIRHHPPKSFPGKLLAFLFERFKAFGGSKHSGMVIIPTELITDNGKKLESILLELAHLNSLDDGFIEWLERSNHFCNSLVDRIVPGKPDERTLGSLRNELGYTDKLLTMAEVYKLWAIEGSDEVRSVLSFAEADEGVIIAPDIEVYRELKLRLLNGTHTLSCGLAYLAGCNTVKEAMDDELIAGYISSLMLDEIVPAIPYAVETSKATEFSNNVLDRFRNPHINHQWLSITANYSSKLKMRCIPVLVKHYQEKETVPELFALGFASYICFLKAVSKTEGAYFAERDGVEYRIQDDQAAIFMKRWAGLSVSALVQEVLSDTNFWGTDLNALPGFRQAVTDKVNLIQKDGIRDAIASSSIKKVTAA